MGNAAKYKAISALYLNFLLGKVRTIISEGQHYLFISI